MIAKIKELNRELKALHRWLLELERIEAEKTLGKKISPLDFLHLLTGDPDFEWLRPLSALIANMDEFLDEAETFTHEDGLRLENEVASVLHQKDSKLKSRYDYYLFNDGEFILLHGKLKAAMKALIKK